MIILGVSFAGADTIDGFEEIDPAISPRDMLIDDWIQYIRDDDGTARKAVNIYSPGQCKRYLINSFAKVAARYAIGAYPDAPLAMPENPNKRDGRIEGAAWTLPSAALGNPFFLYAKYDYDVHALLRDNKANAQALLEKVRPGDVVQMMALYQNGIRGTHTLLITAEYNDETDELYWADSNFRVKMIDGVRYGVVEAQQVWKAAEVVSWLANPSCGATVYRLRYDIEMKNE
jgi:hypothetical protein